MTSKIKHLWMVEEMPGKEGKPPASMWTKIGVAFENPDGSYTLNLAAIPTNGKIQMRDAPRTNETEVEPKHRSKP